MARKLVQYYEFTPGAAGVGTIVLGRPYTLNEILMITNVTDNVVIYNFGDPNRGATLTTGTPSATGSFRAANQLVTTLTLDYDTSGMSAGDQLQIYVEDQEQRTRPYDFGVDAVERQRVAIPRSLIDADFEYGLQATKWASVSSYRQFPTSFEIPGTPITANVQGYTTVLYSAANAAGNINATTSTAVGNIALGLANQGFDYVLSGPNAAGAFAANTAPRHFWNDYKLIVNQGLAGEADCPQSGAPNVVAGGSTVITLPQAITLANGGQFQRSFTVANTTGFNAGDIIAVAGLPDGIGHAAVTTAVVGPTTFNLNANAVIAANAIIAVETAGTGAGPTGYVWELMGVHTSAAGVHGVTRHLWGTNPSNATINSGARIMYLSGNATATLRESSIEMMKVDAVDPTTRQLHVTRQWFNTNANVQFLPNSIVSVVNLRGNIAANTEIVKHIQPSVGQSTTNTFLRGFGQAQGQIGRGFGTSPIAKASTGSHVITMTGVMVVGNASVPMVLINANSHQVPRQAPANANVQISTIGLQNPNIEGVYTNRINDLNYLAYYPKLATIDMPIPGAMLNNNDFSLEVRRAGTYTGGNIKFNAITSNTGTPSLITVSSVNPHGLLPGATLDISLVGGTNADTHGSGIFVVETVPTETTFTYKGKPGASIPNTITNANLVVFSSSLVRHRPLDGGTNIGVNLPVHGYETARQTKKYFRYQSGKGMMFTTGTQFNPVFTIENVTATGTTVGSTIYISCENEHGVQAGANVSLYNIATSGYTGTYRVAGVTSPFQFTVNAIASLGSTQPSFLGNTGSTTPPRVVVRNWHGAKIRAGMFDSANGMFWEYDGQRFYAVRRNATNNLAGLVSVGRDDNRVNGDPLISRFVDQVKAGDNVYIKGMVYEVIKVHDQNTMFIAPGFKGTINAQNAQISVVRELRVPSQYFNLDRLDGTGPSGYVVDLTKMQMVAIQYTWYGAGFIDYGLRTIEGRMIWAHRMTNNNKNDEAYLRSGNLPARYQASNKGIVGQLKTVVPNGTDSEIQLYDVSEFPTDVSAQYPGYVLVDQELMSFSGVNTSTGNLTGLVRGATYNAYVLGANRAFSMGSATTHSVNASVILFSVQASPDLNHWGSSVILDGDFDVDRTYQFNYQVTNVTVNTAQPYTLFMMRLAPSITSALAGDLGVKDIINRAQLMLQNCYISLASTTARCLLQGIVNPENIRAANWQRLNVPQTFNQPSFTQFVANTGFGTAAQAIHFGNIRATQTATGTAGADVLTPYATGGEQLFSIPIIGVNAGFVDLSKVKEIGGAVLPGYGTYPNGPEVVAFNIVPIGTFNTAIDLQVTFLESQA